MNTEGWVGAGIGAEVASGVLTFLSNLGTSIAIGAGFGPVLPVALAGLGIVFIGYGLVQDFFLNKIPANGSGGNVVKPS
jgi:hypothetical protein